MLSILSFWHKRRYTSCSEIFPVSMQKACQYRPASETLFVPLSARQRIAIQITFRLRADKSPRSDADWI